MTECDVHHVASELVGLGTMARRIVVLAAVFVHVALGFVTVAPAIQPDSRLFARPPIGRKNTKSIEPKRSKPSDADLRPSDEGRRSLLFPVAAAVAVNLPLFAVIFSPPNDDEREATLTEWCRSDYCTLLGGGAGY